MRKLLTLTILLFNLIYCRAQGHPGDEDFYGQKFEQTVGILPASPNATEITKYGGINISLNKGMISQSYPIYELKTKEIVVPINLNYSSNGFKVDEYASRVGFNWTLSAGGVITRSVLGHPDEGSTRLNLPGTGTYHNQAFYDYLIKAVGGTNFDTQPDLFNFNFGGYSGQFVLDSNKVPMLLSASNLKVEQDLLSSSSWNFKITTPDGNMYFFGGNGATEETKTETTCGKPYNSYVPTSWYLNKIQSLHGQVVNFNYTPVEFVFYSGASESIYIDQFNPLPCEGGACLQYSAQSAVCTNVIRSHGVYLNSITATGVGSISFSTTTRNDCDDVLYNGITIKDVNTNPQIKYELEYAEYPSNRPFLVKVSKVETSGIIKEQTNFVYNDPQSLPDLNSFSQDHWGYYNGKSGSSLIQKPETFTSQAVFPGATGDRSPDPVFAAKGMLSKIIYPTGGHDTILYEGNDFNEYKSIIPAISTISVNVTGTGLWDQQTANLSFISGFLQQGKLEITVENLTGGGFGHHNLGSFTVETIGGTELYHDIFDPGSSATRIIDLGIGSYNIIVTANGNSVKTTATLTFRPGSVSQQYVNTFSAGVRVKKVVTQPVIGEPQVKRYYYYKPTDTAKSSGVVVATPNYEGDNFQSRRCCIYSGVPVYDYCTHRGMFSSAISPSLLYDGGVSYQAVTEGFGENFENGSIEHLYHTAPNTPASSLNSGTVLRGAPLSNTGFMDGKEKQTSVYRNSAGVLQLIKQSTTTYKIDERLDNYVEGTAVNRRYNNCYSGPTPGPNEFEEFELAGYTKLSRWIYADTTTETTYDINGANPQVIQTVYQYDNPVHMLPSKTITTLSNGTIQETVTKYPLDYSGITATDTLSAAIKNLQTNYLTAVPVEKAWYLKNGDGSNIRLTGAMFNLFKHDTTDIKQIWQIEPVGPLTDFSASAVVAGKVNVDGRYRKQVLFEKYDSKGNLLQQSQPDDSKKAYIWDYSQTLPIAEALNATVDRIAYTSFEGDGLGNWQKTGTALTAGGITGVKSLNGSLTKTAPSGNYIITAWKMLGSTLTVNSTTGTLITAANGWQLYYWKLTAVSTITVSGTNMDEVRLYPEGAQMSSYTHNLLKGISTMSDINNRVSYFEYDGFNRLTVVRDENKNVLKKICYNIYGQPEDCLGNTAALWQPTGVTRCKPCPENGSYTSNILQKQEIDNNLQSPTGGDIRWIDDGVSTACNVIGDWQNTATPLRCQKNGSNQNTGYQEQEQRDMNPCSETYNQTQWQTAGLNVSACPPPVPCTTGNCTGVGKKCVNNVCETGVKVYTSCVYVTHSIYLQTYHYEWSDGSWSSDYTESTSICIIEL